MFLAKAPDLVACDVRRCAVRPGFVLGEELKGGAGVEKGSWRESLKGQLMVNV